MTNVILKKTGEGRNSRGEITVWERPREGAEYIIGADVAQGATFGTAKRDADKSTICVLRRDGMLVHHVAEAVYQTENFSFGQVIAALGQWYNNAWVNVERNLAHGVIAGLRVAQYPTERWYIPPISASTAESQAGSYFFHKNVSTQKVLLDTLLAYMDPHAPRLVMGSASILAEVASLQIDAMGKVDTNGKDLTIALSMAIIVDATTELDIQRDVPSERRPQHPPHGVDPDIWREKHGLKKPVRNQETDEAPEWEGSLDGVPDWSAVVN